VSNRHALLLSSVMMRGYGVSVVAQEVQRRIGRYGWDLTIGCVSSDDDFGADRVVTIGASADEVASFGRSSGVEVVVAQTTPYFEMLPALVGEIPTVVFEHGDPSPAFFDEDADERQRIRRNKIVNVYPHVSRVLASSHFLRHDIEWLAAGVVPLGCDHVPDLGPKDLTLNAHRRSRPLRVGTLMRLGEGESRYKGVELFADLVEMSRSGGGIEFAIMGRGSDEDRDRWEAVGVEVHLNASDDERASYLRDLDVLISPSLWEGFNLPLVEAQASGTVGLAFDVGAHPETTPYLMSTLDDAADLLGAWRDDREELARASRSAYRFARSKFTWDQSARLLASHLDDVARPRQVPIPPGPVAGRVDRLERLVRREGFLGAGQAIGLHAGRRLRRSHSGVA
jgi:glycosyltransferase involved in cell wall biosynthesis